MNKNLKIFLHVAVIVFLTAILVVELNWMYNTLLEALQDNDKDFCYLYANEKIARDTYTQHNYYLLEEMNKEANEYYNVSYDYNPNSKKLVFVIGDGELISHSLDSKTLEPLEATCSYPGTVYEGDIVHHFEVVKEINISELRKWRKQFR